MRHILIEYDREHVSTDYINTLTDLGFTIQFGTLNNALNESQIVIVDAQIELQPERLRCLRNLVRTGSVLAGLWALQSISKSACDQKTIEMLLSDVHERFKCILITTTGLDSLTIDYLSLLMTSLGGRIDKNFTHETTHLIVHTVGTPKHSAALKMKKPCLKMKWIFECFEKGNQVPETSFAVPALFNCIVSVSQLDTSERNRIKSVVESNGGRYSADLSYDCTHLICNQPIGDKYNFAQQWNIQIVRESWLDAMLQNGGSCVDIRPHLLDTLLQDSTSVEIITDPKVPSLHKTLSLDHIEYDPESDDYLSGCVVVLVGFTEERLYNHLCSILQYGGATRLHQMRPFVTHAVLAHDGAGSVSTNSCRSVNYQWLLDCYKAKACVAITEEHRPKSAQIANDQNLVNRNQLIRCSSITGNCTTSFDVTESLTATGTSNHVSISAPSNFSFFNQSLDKGNASNNKRRKMLWR